MKQEEATVSVPLMVQVHPAPHLATNSVFKLRPDELTLFFERRHNVKPFNEGEKRECLVILEKAGLYDGHDGKGNGLLDKISTDREVRKLKLLGFSLPF